MAPTPTAWFGRVAVIAVGSAPVAELRAAGFGRIVAVDDAERVSADREATVLRHAVPLGPNAAIRTGINYALTEFADLASVLVIDSPHSTADILRVAQLAWDAPDALVLGHRAPGGRDGWLARLGHEAARQAVGTASTTGLAFIPAQLARDVLARTDEDVVIAAIDAARHYGAQVLEQPVLDAEPSRAIFESSSRPFAFVRFLAAWIAAAVIDGAVVFIARKLRADLATAQTFASLLSSIALYRMARDYVFVPKTPESWCAPRFSALAAGGALVVYACLAAATTSLNIPLVWAKILLDIALAFPMFVLLRAWAFARPFYAMDDEAGQRESSAPHNLAYAAALWASLAIAAFLVFKGLRAERLFAQTIWTPPGLDRFWTYTRLFAVIAFGFSFARRWFRLAFAAAVIGLSMFAVGPIAPLAVLFFVASCAVLGRLLFGREIPGAIAFVAGLALWAFGMQLAARTPVHYWYVYVAILAATLAAGYRQLRPLALDTYRALFPEREPSILEHAALALAAYIFIAQWLVVLKPEISSDALASHLAIPADMAVHHAFTIDFRQTIWALMPLGSDFCYAVLYMLGGEYAARLLNLAALGAIAAMISFAGKRALGLPLGYLLAALFMSAPVVNFVTGSMFVENFIAATLLGSAIACAIYWQTRSPRAALLAALLAGVAGGLKIGALAVGWMLFGALILKIRSDWPLLRRRALLVSTAAAIFLVASSWPYGYAWVRAHNPVYPFANSRFHSPYIDEELRDARFAEPATWHTLYDMTFRTHKYLESLDGGIGFAYLLFLPLALVAWPRLRTPGARLALGVAVADGVVVAYSVPNARYYYWLFALFVAGLAGVFAALAAERRWLFRAAIVAAVIVFFLNLPFTTAASDYHRDFYTSPPFSAKGRADYLLQRAPSRMVVDYLNRKHPNEPVLLTEDTARAGLIAPSYVNAWHDLSFAKRLRASTNVQQTYALLAKFKIQHFMTPVNRDPALSRPLAELMGLCGVPEFRAGAYEALEMSPDCAAKIGARGTGNVVLEPGTYDDADLRIVYEGEWAVGQPFEQAYERTVSYTHAVGAFARIRFAGTGIDYAFTRAPNRGRAEVVIDGASKQIIDLYNDKVAWQSKIRIDGLPPGQHEAVVKATGDKNQRASDCFIDLDAINVLP